MLLNRHVAYRILVIAIVVLPAVSFNRATHLAQAKTIPNDLVVVLRDITSDAPCTLGYGHSEAEANSNTTPCPAGTVIKSYPMRLVNAQRAHLQCVTPVLSSDGLTVDNAATMAAVGAARRDLYNKLNAGIVRPFACVYNGLPIYQKMQYGGTNPQIYAEVYYFDAQQNGVCVLNAIHDHNRETPGGLTSWWNKSTIDSSPNTSNRGCPQVPQGNVYDNWQGGLPQGTPNSQWFQEVDTTAQNCGFWLDSYVGGTSTLNG